MCLYKYHKFKDSIILVHREGHLLPRTIAQLEPFLLQFLLAFGKVIEDTADEKNINFC